MCSQPIMERGAVNGDISEKLLLIVIHLSPSSLSGLSFNAHHQTRLISLTPDFDGAYFLGISHVLLVITTPASASFSEVSTETHSREPLIATGRDWINPEMKDLSILPTTHQPAICRGWIIHALENEYWKHYTVDTFFYLCLSRAPHSAPIRGKDLPCPVRDSAVETHLIILLQSRIHNVNGIIVLAAHGWSPSSFSGCPLHLKLSLISSERRKTQRGVEIARQRKGARHDEGYLFELRDYTTSYIRTKLKENLKNSIGKARIKTGQG